MNESSNNPTPSENTLNQSFWNEKYKTNTTAWDLGEIAPAIKSFINTIEDKNKRILIPGCGNCYEAAYLLEQHFTNITVIDIAPIVVENLKIKFKDNFNIVLGDFFEHQGEYDLVIEQTFFCALPPEMREKYVDKMHQLLAYKGKVVGLLFNRTFEMGPPFGGSQKEYETLFLPMFNILKMEDCQESVAPRVGSELWIELQKIN